MNTIIVIIGLTLIRPKAVKREKIATIQNVF